jgi:phenylacetate-coenzyme A ligase PaaK-like adenylate-forming protein
MADFDVFRRRVQARIRAGMAEAVDRLDWKGERLARRQTEGLRALLAHALAASPFHQDRLRGLDASRFELADLETLPVMTKAELMAQFDRVVTDRRLTRDLAEATLARTGETPIPMLGRYVAFASGGSSGVRGVFVWDEAALAEFALAMLRPLHARMAAAGGVPPGGLRGALVAASSAVHVTGSAPAWTAGEALAFTAVPATLPLPEAAARLERLQPHVLMGYPSALARLAREQAAGRLAIRPLSVSATSETLTPEHRETIEAGFGAPVVNTFGSSEGLVGHSAPGEAPLTFNTDLCLVELVDADYRPTPPGVPSQKVLITNLANPAQPLIRYELADRFVAVAGGSDVGHLRACVEGRADDLLWFGSAVVHPHAVSSVLVRRPEVVDYQARQTARGLDIALVVEAGCDLAPVTEELKRSLLRAGLADPEVTVRRVPSLPAHAQSGKLRRIVPLEDRAQVAIT